MNHLKGRSAIEAAQSIVSGMPQQNDGGGAAAGASALPDAFIAARAEEVGQVVFGRLLYTIAAWSQCEASVAALNQGLKDGLVRDPQTRLACLRALRCCIELL